MNDIFERLLEERELLGINQGDFALMAGITPRSQRNYETGVRVPDAVYLASISEIGADVNYIITGVRTKPVDSRLNDDEQALLRLFRAAPAAVKAAAIGALQGGAISGAAVFNNHSGSRVQQQINTVSGGLKQRFK